MKAYVRLALILSLVIAQPSAAWAGMPSVTLTDSARLRLSTISFFLVVLFLSAAIIRWLWNALAEDFASLPRITYGKAVAVVVLWGLAFVLVLTMISGARELMTPGAWKKDGATYKLKTADDTPSATPSTSESASKLELRRARITRLGDLLCAYAMKNDRRFPEKAVAEALPSDFWSTPDSSAMRYLYVPGRTLGDPELPVIYEPAIFGDEVPVHSSKSLLEVLMGVS